jgi:hypothetical protein
MSIISEKDYAQQSAFQSIRCFFREFAVGSALKKSGAYKTRGIPVVNIITYLTFLVYGGKTMNRDAASKNSGIGGSTDAVYRFLRRPNINWNTLLLSVGGNIVVFFKRLTGEDRKTALVIDDTLYERPYSRKTELVARVFDHVTNQYKRGFRTLFVSWTDGASLVPLCFRHLSSAEEKNRYVPEKEGLDKRTCACRAKQEAKMKATDVCLRLLEKIGNYGIPAQYVLFDCWFAFPVVIAKITGLGYDVTCRIKKMPKIYYFFEGKKLNLKQIYNQSKKRRGRSRYLLSVDVHIQDDEGRQVPCRIVCVRNKANRKDWIAILSTDMSLTPQEVIELYGKRWSIEVFFKTCKTYLRFTGEFQQTAYQALTAHTAIVALRYMILCVEQRRQTDHRTLGELFYDVTDEAVELSFRDVLGIIMTGLMQSLTKSSVLFEEVRVKQFMESFISGLPAFIQRLLLPASAPAIPAF